MGQLMMMVSGAVEHLRSISIKPRSQPSHSLPLYHQGRVGRKSHKSHSIGKRPKRIARQTRVGTEFLCERLFAARNFFEYNSTRSRPRDLIGHCRQWDPAPSNGEGCQGQEEGGRVITETWHGVVHNNPHHQKTSKHSIVLGCLREL